MKLCMVSAYPPNKANLSEYGQYMADAFTENPEINELVVLANSKKGVPRESGSGKLKIMRCWKTNSFLTPFGILACIKKLRPDIVHFNIGLLSWGTNRLVNFVGGLTPLLARMLLRSNVVITLHNVGNVEELNRIGFIKPNLINKAGCWIITDFLLRAGVTIVTLRDYAKLLKRQYKKDDILWIPLGVPRTGVNAVRVGGRKILALGHWSKSKNLPVLLDAFVEISKRYKNAELLIAGESHPKFSGYMDTLKVKYKHNKIKFLGYVPENKLRNTFLNSTVVVLPYMASTGSSSVLSLAMAYGRPVVASDMKLFRNDIKFQKSCIELFRNGDRDSLIRSIEKIFASRKLQFIMGKGNLEASKKYTFDKITRMYIEVFKKVLRRKYK